MDELDDRELIMQARNGSADGSGALFERRWLSAWRTAYALTGRRELARRVVDIEGKSLRRSALGAALSLVATAISVAAGGCADSVPEADRPAAAGTTGPADRSTRQPPVEGAAGSTAVRRIAHEDCSRLGPIPATRVASNPKARRVGPVVFTPLALSRSLTLQPEDIVGAPDALSIKIGATVITGGPSARVGISAPGGARLLYGPELLQALAEKSLRWSELPRAVVFERCRNEQGAAVTTAFPGGFVLRRAHTCVRLRVVNGRGRTTIRAFAFGRGPCREPTRR